MGEFFSPELESEAVIKEKPKVFTEDFLVSVVKKTLASGDIPKDHSLYLIAATDESGIKAIVGIRKNLSDSSYSINFIAEHEWDGDNRVGARVVWSMK